MTKRFQIEQDEGAATADFIGPDSFTPEGRKILRRAIAASAMGNATEWFDYGVYAVAAVYISKNFFPGDAAMGTMWTLATFALSFLVRPLGGLFWGPLGDRIGRKRVLALTIILMAGSTFAIGLLPTYALAGALGPALLILLRMVQGFSTGGEYGGAATFMAEYAPDKKRGFYGSFLEFGTLAGFALGSLIVLVSSIVLGDGTMNAWGWRIPFLVAGPLGIVGMYLRNRLQDTPIFRELEAKGGAEKTGMSTLRDLFLNYRRPMLTMAALVIALNVVNYTLLTYMPTYLETTVGMDATTVLTLMFVGQLGMMAIIPLAGRHSDRIGRRPMWMVSLVGLFVLAVPVYMMMTHGFWFAMLGFAVLGLLYVPQLATISATFPAMFPTHVRYAGFAITYNVSTAVFGGTAPLVNELLVHSTGNNLVPAFYMMGACAIGFMAVLAMPETAGTSLRGMMVPGRLAKLEPKRAG